MPLLEATECLHGSRLISWHGRFVTDLDPKGWQPPTVAKDELLDNWLAHHTPLSPKNASDRQPSNQRPSPDERKHHKRQYGIDHVVEDGDTGYKCEHHEHDPEYRDCRAQQLQFTGNLERRVSATGGGGNHAIEP